MRKNIFFDVDGVLIQGMKDGVYLWDKDLEKDLGIKDADKNRFLNENIDSMSLGTIDFKSAIIEFLNGIGARVSAEEFIKYWFEKDSNVNFELLELVKELGKDNNVYIASTQTHERAGYLWNVLGFREYFKDIYYSAKLGVIKDHAEFYRLIEEDLGIDVNVNQPVIIDDSKKVVEAANNAGWMGILFGGEGVLKSRDILKIIC